jgi:hypothetical protein
MAVFWVVAPCCLVVFLQRFIGPCCLAMSRPDEGGSKDLCNFGKLVPDYTVLQPRRQPSSDCRFSFDCFKYLACCLAV